MKKTDIYKYFPEMVYGSIDGMITTFASVAGGAGASLSHEVLIILGLANIAADGLSMAIGSYLSQDNDSKNPYIAAIVTFVSFAVMGFMPLMPYIWDIQYEGYISIGIMGLGLILIGYCKSIVTNKPRRYSISQTVILGVIAAGAAYIVGDLVDKVI